MVNTTQSIINNNLLGLPSTQSNASNHALNSKDTLPDTFGLGKDGTKNSDPFLKLAGFSKESGDASQIWGDIEKDDQQTDNEDGENTNAKNNEDANKAHKEALANQPQDKKITKEEEAKRKKDKAASATNGKDNLSKGKSSQADAKGFQGSVYKPATALYKTETAYNSKLAAQFKETLVKPKEAKQSTQQALEKVEQIGAKTETTNNKIASFQNAISNPVTAGSTGDSSSLGGGSAMGASAPVDKRTLNNPQTMANALQQAKSNYLPQIKRVFNMAHQLGQQALQKSQQGKQKADRGNSQITQGILSIVQGSQQITEGIPLLADIFTIPEGIAMITAGGIAIAGGITTIAAGKDQVDNGNQDIQAGQTLNRQSEAFGQNGVEASDALDSAAQDIIARLEDMDGQNDSLLKKLDPSKISKMQQQRAKAIQNIQAKTTTNNTNGLNKTSGPNLSAKTSKTGTKGAGKSLIPGQQDENKDYMESYKKTEEVLKRSMQALNQGIGGANNNLAATGSALSHG